jgi:hypothetical protein
MPNPAIPLDLRVLRGNPGRCGASPILRGSPNALILGGS